MAQAQTRDDCLLPATRLLSAVIVPFLVLAFVVLVPDPDDTGRLFAWAIHPRFTAMLLGSVYLGGAYFFAVVARGRVRWHSVRGGFVSVATFATLMGVITIVHWDRFAHAHVAFWLWVALYFTTPFLVTAVWWANQRRLPSPHLPDGDVVVGRLSASLVSVVGVLATATSAALLLAPGRMARVWPWALTPLTGRVVGAIFALGVSAIGASRERRWSAYRVLVVVEIVMLALVAVAVVRARGEFDTGRPLTWLMAGGLAVVLVASTVASVVTERSTR